MKWKYCYRLERYLGLFTWMENNKKTRFFFVSIMKANFEKLLTKCPNNVPILNKNSIWCSTIPHSFPIIAKKSLFHATKFFVLWLFVCESVTKKLSFLSSSFAQISNRFFTNYPPNLLSSINSSSSVKFFPHEHTFSRKVSCLLFVRSMVFVLYTITIDQF